MIECNKPPQYHIAHINAALVHIALQYRYRTSRVVTMTHIYIHRSTHSQPYVSMAHMLHNPDPTESLRQLPSIIPTFVEPYYDSYSVRTEKYFSRVCTPFCEGVHTLVLVRIMIKGP